MAEIKKIEKNVGSQTTKKVEKEQSRRKTTDSVSRLMSDPESLTREDVLQAQHEVGNQAIQRKLDRSAARSGETEGALSEDMSERIQRKRGSGSALPEQVRRTVGKQLGHDLGGVRIHTDSEADKLTRSVSARAFTIGSDIFFKNGVYAPDSEKGRETIVHELTHVVQQSKQGSGSGRLKLGAPDTSMEKEADKTGKKLAAMSFKSSSAGGNAAAAVQRQMPEEEEPLQAQRDPMVQRQASEEEELQMQRDPIIQRQAPEEEELQMQRDPMIQRQAPEEEELQMQRDPMIQRQAPEEEELQMQRDPMIQRQAPEEEELQMQPDPMIQRDLLEEIQAEKLRRMQTGGRKRRIEQTEKIEEKNEKNALDPKIFSTAKVQQGQSEQKAKALTEQSKKMGIGSKKNLSKLEKLDEGRAKKDKESREKLFKEEKEDKKTKSRTQLMDTIRNKNSSTEDVKAAQEKLDMLHKRSKLDTFKSAFTPGKTSSSYSEQAMKSRKIGLKSAAEGGDEKAFEKYKTEKAERKQNSKSSKVLGFLGKAGMGLGKGIAGIVGGQISKQLGNYKEHFFGKSEEKDDDDKEKEKSGGKSEKGDSVGAGMGSMMEKYGDLVRQNEDLKRRLEKYEPSKS